MPLSERLQVLESDVREAVPGVEFRVRSGDLFSVTKAERDALLDSMLVGADYPFVLVDGVVMPGAAVSAEGIASALGA